MRGLDPRIHAVAGSLNGRCQGVDGRIKSGHDELKLHKRHLNDLMPIIRVKSVSPSASIGAAK